MSVIVIIEHRCCILGTRHAQLISKYSGSHEAGFSHLTCEIPEEEIRKKQLITLKQIITVMMRQNNENYDNIDVVTIIMMMIIEEKKIDVVTIIMMMIVEENLCGDHNNDDDY